MAGPYIVHSIDIPLVMALINHFGDLCFPQFVFCKDKKYGISIPIANPDQESNLFNLVHLH